MHLLVFDSCTLLQVARELAVVFWNTTFFSLSIPSLDNVTQKTLVMIGKMAFFSLTTKLRGKY